MANKNSSDFTLTKTSSANLAITTSSAQATANFPQMDGYLVQTIFATTADATVASTVTETTVVGTATGTKTLPVNFLASARTLRFRVEGYMGDTGTPTLNLKFKFGSTQILATGAQTLSTITGSQRWIFEGIITCRSTGGSGTVYAQGELRYWSAATTMIGISAVSTSTVTVDTTATQAIDITATWGTSSASNTITCTNVLVETMM